ncbi:hypothetical protein KP509_08G024400 [Ceratopteris richardii]|uniref:PABC domain-containing protein n=1 Tax=Ceratopteris richardii TaxID=49495 RepID=A0A8T2U908_CERRI|nr:hypothetical protein KP509_08G024400 [Ceratopteris richardii]
MFGKCNKPEKLIEVFDAIKEHDAVTWNTLISVFTNQGNGGQRALFIGKRIHALIANNSIAQDVVLGTAIWNMYAFLQQVMPLGANRPMCYSQASRDVTTTSVPGTNFEMGGVQVLPSDVGFMPRQALASALASTPPDQHRMMLGEQLYPLVDQIEHDHAGKVTGMLLDWKWISLRYCTSLNLLMP